MRKCGGRERRVRPMQQAYLNGIGSLALQSIHIPDTWFLSPCIRSQRRHQTMLRCRGRVRERGRPRWDRPLNSHDGTASAVCPAVSEPPPHKVGTLPEMTRLCDESLTLPSGLGPRNHRLSDRNLVGLNHVQRSTHREPVFPITV